MGNPHTRIESTGDVPREVRVAAASCFLKNYARDALSKKGRGATAPISAEIDYSNGPLLSTVLQRKIYSEGVSYSFQASNFGDLRGRLAGRVFSATAQSYVEARENHGDRVIVDGDKTLEVYKHLYPTAEVHENGFGATSLDGISVPDGLVISRSGRVTNVIEYKASLKNKQGKRSIHDQLTSELISFLKKFPELAVRNLKMLLVTPILDDKQVPDDVKEDSRIDHVQVPFGTGALSGFIDKWFNTYQPEANRGSYEIGRKGRRIPKKVDEIDMFGPTLAELWQFRKERDAQGAATVRDFAEGGELSLSEVDFLARAAVVFDPEAALTSRTK